MKMHLANPGTVAFVRAFVVATLLLFPQSLFAQRTIELPEDSVAGFDVPIRIAPLREGETIQAEITTPSKRTEELPPVLSESGEAIVTIPGAQTHEAGTYGLTVHFSAQTTSEETTFTVLPDALDPDRSDLAINRALITAGSNDSATVTVTTRDSFSNAIGGRVIELIGNGDDVIEAIDPETDENGAQRFTVRASRAGTMTLRAFDVLSGITLPGRVTLSVVPNGFGGPQSIAQNGWNPGAWNPWMMPPWWMAPPMFPYQGSLVAPQMRDFVGQTAPLPGRSFTVEVEPSELQAGEVAKVLRIIAPDPAYRGTIEITSSDPDADLPGDTGGTGRGRITFTEKKQGKSEIYLSLRFMTESGPEGHVIRVEDRATGIVGETRVVVRGTSASARRGITVRTPVTGGSVGQTFKVRGTGPKFANLIVTFEGGAVEDVVTETAEDGAFSASIELPTGITEARFTVRDESGQYSSGTVAVRVDTDGPKVTFAGLTPEKPEAGSQVVFVAKADSKSTLTLKTDDREISLAETKTPGTYQALITAPANSGSYEWTVVARDAAENATSVRAIVVIAPRSLPTVSGLETESRPNAVFLTWKKIEEATVKAYRIYVSEDRGKTFPYSLDTKDALPSALVAGLRPGEEYTFAVTAINDEQESAQRSDMKTGKPLGMQVTATPMEGALDLQWTFPEEGMANFKLEFGIGKFTNTALIHGAQRRFRLSDLLPGLTYTVRLTPITTTGELLEELSASARGNVLGDSAFHAAAGDPIPFDSDAKPAMRPRTHAGASRVSVTGLPPSMLWGAAILAIAVLAVLSHRRRLRSAEVFFREMDRRYQIQNS